MSEDPFGKWWPCLRKHFKRRNIWLPRAKELTASLNGQRPFRYFTLCARPMIDVYMLLKENVLTVDQTERRIKGVSFCEIDQIVFPEMIELIGMEEAGFLAKLEDLTLFDDTQNTETLDTILALDKFLDEQGEGLNHQVREAVERKRQHLQFRDLFPFDFLNLDFCDRYYGNPPDVMKINFTIDKLLDWQRQQGIKGNGDPFSIKRFVLAITCRVDNTLTQPTSARLANIIDENANQHAPYKNALHGRGITNIAKWSSEDPLDFFMSGWPKEIARMAFRKQWDIKIHDHAFYDRVNDHGKGYHMVCLVVEFTQAPICSTYLSAATYSLSKASRTEIQKQSSTDPEGAKLLADLRKIVELRNNQAQRVNRDVLPDPLTEITRLRAQGVQI
jgi:hypothetical protein